MQREKYTFAIMAYNQEDMILDLLYSVKYQKENFGQEIDITLLVYDDASTDKTVDVTRAWIEKYSDLFKKTKIMVSTENKGTVHSFITLMEAIDNDDFKLLAGDDVFSNSDVFHSVLNSDHMCSYVPYTLIDGEVLLNSVWYARHLERVSRRHSNKYYRKRQEIGSYFYTPCTFFKYSLYTRYYKGTRSPFKLYEDDFFFHTILKENDKCKVSFVDDDRVLYRIHSRGISTSDKGATHDTFLNEYYQYKRMLAKEEKDWLLKLYLGIMSRQCKNVYLYIPNYIERVSKLFRNIQIKYIPQYRRAYKAALEKISSLQRYYDEIHDQALSFKNSL